MTDAVNSAPDNKPANSHLPVWIGYAAAVVLEAALTGFLLLIQPYLPLGGFPVYYFLLTMLIAYFFGVGPAILAVLLGLFAYDYFFIPPLGTIIPHVETTSGWAALIAYITGTSLVAFATLMIRRSKRRTERYAKRLEASERRYRSLFENMLDGFAYCRMEYDEAGKPIDFIYLDVNESFGRLTGLQDVVGKRVTEVIPGIRESNPELFGIYGRVAATGQPERFEIDFKPLDKWLDISVYSPERGHFVAVFDDITVRKKAEAERERLHSELEIRAKDLQSANEQLASTNEELAATNEELVCSNEELEATTEELRCESEEREHAEEELKTTLESIGDGFFAVDKDWRFVYVNSVAERLLNIKRNEVLGKSHWDVFPLMLGTRLETEYRQAAGGKACDFEFFYEPWQRWFLNRCYPREGGGMSVYFQDITEQKQAEERERKRESEQQEFYKRTILAATEGKLIIANRDEICSVAGRPIASWEMSTPQEIGPIRHSVESMALDAGMDEDRVSKFVMAVGEAITNAFKHGEGGRMTMHRLPEGLMFITADSGPGIPSLALPDVALTKGYSTAGTLGMGYKYMITFSDKVYLATGSEGTTVALVMGFEPPKGTPLGLSSLGNMLEMEQEKGSI